MPEVYSRVEHLYLTPGLKNRTRFYSETDRAVIGTIRCGVLFILAFWSGPARLALGEAAWVQGGKIVRTSGFGFKPDCFESNTRELLKECVRSSDVLE
jgi:hypothetical protein